MVAYSFKARFGPPILAGTKAQTIRADRKRHARLGEPVQLYIGMRTKHCRLLGRPTCIEIVPVRLYFQRYAASELFQVGDACLTPRRMETFAQADGFASVEEMARFWFEEHGAEHEEIDFRGVLIRWTPLVPADALDIGAAA